MGAHDLLHEMAGAGFHITARADRLVIRPWSKLTDEMRDALRNAKPELLALLRGGTAERDSADLAAVAWTDGDIAAFLDRRARLLHWGWAEADAERLAERLVKRDREHDERVSCTECSHYRPGRCASHRHAGLHSAELGRDLAAKLQRCAGFKGPGT